MEILYSIVSGVLTKVGEYAVAPVGRQVGYVIQYKSNLQNLRTQVDNLKERRQRTIDVNWMTQQVDELTGEVDTFLVDEGHAKNKCFHGYCPNPILYYQLSKKATKLMHKIKLHEDTEFPPQEICCVPSQDYLDFGSRISVVKEIMDELSNPNTNKIGVYGVGGVGKTTLAEEVYRQANEKKLFDGVVIVVDVKNYPERIQKENYIERIQKEIAEKLDIDIRQCQTEKGRARHLWDKLKDKKILVILDDVWEKIELKEVGIPPASNILFTSRNREVLYCQMGTQKDFSLDVLDEEESWRLFEKMAGAVVKDKRIREIATHVLNRCGGLPILIVAVASALRNGTLHQWKDALRRLKKLDIKESEEKALLTLEWSYNQLDAEELKPLFLLCGVIAWGHSSIFLSDCFKYSMGMGLLKKVDTMEEAQAAFHSLIKKLQNYCLLLEQQDGDDFTFVRMHDLVCNVAIRIARRDQQVLVSAYDEEELKEWPNKDFFKYCTMICLSQSNIPKLPEVPWECRELKMLLFNSEDSVAIPCSFFEDMKRLKVLDLSGFPIPSLPPSLQFLTHLQTLCLDRCVLEDIALVGQLRNLEILSLMLSKITKLPKEIGQLAHLRMLDLTGCSELVLISPNVIASLKNLEDLRMGRNSFRQWEAEGVRNASLLELKQLSKLTALDIHIPDANILPSDCFSKLERFHIFIGVAWKWLDFDDSVNTLKLKLDTNSQLNRGLEMLLKRCEHLYLDVSESVNNISHLLNGSDGFQQLKHLQVQNNAEITQVFNYNSFQNLKSLKLWNLPKLVSFSSEGGTAVVTTRTDKELKIDGKSKQIISENEIGSPVQLLKSWEIVMHNLTSLIVHKCDGLTFLLSPSMARSLVQLNHLEIRSCQIMEEIVSIKESGEENTENVFCKLTHLELQHLPKLTRFCSGNLIKFPSLEILHLEDCTELRTFISDPPMISDNITIYKDNDKSDLKDNLETAGQYFLFNEKVAFSSLERLIIYDLPKLITIWHNQLAQDSFCRLKKLDIQRCHYLINIFAASIMGELNALDTLQIEDCKSLQVLFEHDGINAERTDESSGTQLRIVECCQNLDLVKIISCERLKNIFPASVVKSLHNLRMLHVELCNGVETIVGKKEGPQTTIPKFMFPKVISVEFKNLPQLISFYPGMHSSKWPLLKELVMNECHKVGIVASEFLRFQEKLASAPWSKQPFFLIEKGSLLNLETLFLGDAELEIWDGPLPEELSATWPCKLKKFWCNSKSSAAFLEKLRNLEGLSMGYTPFKEIFVNEAYSSSVGSPQLLHLTFLELYKMPDLVHLGKDNSQPVIPNLEILNVLHCVRLLNLMSPAIAFQNLTTLKVIGCHGLEFLTICSIAQSLMQLEHMEVKDCRGLIQILENSNQDSGSIEIAFLRLQHLELSSLPSLQGFCSGNCIVKLPSLDTLTVDNADITCVINHNAFYKLQSLTLMNLPKPVSFSTRTDNQLKLDGESREIMLKNEIATPVQLFKNGEIVMPNLTSLIVHQFNGLRFLLSSSMARSLVQLKHLEIRSCQIMEEIVSTKESDEENTENVFCKLTHLELQHLPKLTRFCSGNLIKFPSLEILHLEDCTELRTFISDPPMISDNITTCKDNSESDLKNNLESARQYFLFDEKVAFPSLERLIIYDLPKLMTIWHNQLAQSSFCRLKKLEVQRCQDLTKIFAASIMGRLNALDTLQIENCKSLQVLFELYGINAEKTDESSGTQLRIVECCQNLDLVKIISCERLKNIFPASVVKSLHNLRMLHVELCNGVETIVGKEEGPQTTIPKFMFPKVISVEFKNLPQLMSFYPGMHSSKWPLLKKLVMNECHKVGIVASEFLRFQEKLASTPGSKQPFFLIEKGSFLNLETLFLGDAELEIWDGPLPEELSATWPCKLKKFWCYSKSSAAFLEKLRNLEFLSMGYTPFKEMFVNEAYSSSVGSPQLLHLRTLQLYKMPELVHVGKDNSQPVIPNLEILMVYHCVRLRNLTSPAIAFQNLTTLKVIGCNGLKFLTTCSIAESLMQLQHMEVKDCRGLIQILENSNQDSGSIEIAFLRLQHLELSGLPSLQRFCSGNCIVKLPSLDTLTVDNADITYVINHNAFQKLQSLTLMNLPKPVSFSTRTDKQLKIDGESREIMLKNDIGTPVQLFKNEEIVMPNLTSLIVHQLNGLRFLLSSSMARSLVQLKHLEIRSCQIMEEIVSTKESDEENTENVFCKLTHLELQHLPKLTRFCSGNLIKFPSLEILHLEDCTELRTFISDPPMISDNITTCKDNSESDLKDNLESARQYFLFDEKVAFPSLERLIIYDLPKLTTIWHNQLAQSPFCRLKKLEVQRCQDLTKIFAASIMGRLNALDTLQIENCKSLQVLFELYGINAEKTDESSGTQLRIVECCQNLDLVKIISCERLKNIFPASVVKSLHNLRMLHVELCNGVETIVGKEEGPQTTIPKFMFPKVISVEFKNLPQLMSFYPGMHSSKWPLLKKLVMNECHKVGIVASEFLRFQEKLASTPRSKQPLFLIEKGSLLNLESLALGDAELEIWDGPLPEELSATWPCKLKTFWCYSKSSAAFLEKLPNLEVLSMGYTPFKEILVNEAYSSSVGSPQLLHLTTLELYKMPELVYLGNDNSQPVIPNLEILMVYHCVRLRNLTSPAIAFQNLTTLKVIGCNGLKFLTTCSIAESLMQLKHMEVKDCRGLIQILENSNQDSGSIEIAFLPLQHLELSGLPSLQRFCSGNCIVKLPSLDTLTVSDCLIELELSAEKLLLSNSRPERIKLIEEEEKDHDKPDGSGNT